MAICISLEKCLLNSFASFLISFLLFLLFNCRTYFYVLNIKPLLDICLTNIFFMRIRSCNNKQVLDKYPFITLRTLKLSAATKVWKLTEKLLYINPQCVKHHIRLRLVFNFICGGQCYEMTSQWYPVVMPLASSLSLNVRWLNDLLFIYLFLLLLFSYSSDLLLTNRI